MEVFTLSTVNILTTVTIKVAVSTTLAVAIACLTVCTRRTACCRVANAGTCSKQLGLLTNYQAECSHKAYTDS